jgi:beta-galactosidase
MLFGASYYHEYQPVERLDRDLELMRQAGFTAIRVGESTWSSYEPRDGEISFDALSRVVDGAVEHGMKVIVGTPTYAIPPWLARQHPEVMARTSTQDVIPYGARQNIDFTHPAYRFHAERLIRKLAQQFGSLPGVIGFQVDNEIGVHHLANPHLVERFRDHVLTTFGDVEEINRAWGLSYWSHRLSQIADLWAPEGNTSPGYALEWERFQAGLTVEFLSWQRDLLREYIAPEQFITHDLIGGSGGRSTEIRAISEAMERTSVNIYFPMQAALTLPEPNPPTIRNAGPEWMEAGGTWSVLWRADLAYSAKGPRGSRFFVTEAQAGSIGGPSTNVSPFPGQLRLVAQLMVSRGADLIAYWHWHTLHYGLETYWGGVLGHDLEPNRIFAEVSKLGAHIKHVAPHLDSAVPDADIAILFSRDSAKALEFMPALNAPNTPDPDGSSYHRIFRRFYQGAVDKRLQLRVVHVDSDWTDQPVLIVPALYIADEELLTRLLERARGGAHVVFTFRSGVADQWARVRWQRQPGPLREAVGASYQEFSTLSVDTPVVAESGDAAGAPRFTMPSGATVSGWADLLVSDSADVLFRYDDPFLGNYAAVSTNEYGAGRVTWIGTLPDRVLAGTLVEWALQERGLTPIAAMWPTLSDSVSITSSLRPDGHRLWFLSNHSWNPVDVDVKDGATVISAPEAKQDQAEATTLTLGPWDSTILVEEVQ